MLRPGQKLRWLWGVGLGLPIMLGGVLVVGILISLFTGNHYKPPERLDVGLETNYVVNAPKYFETERIWIVRLDETNFEALYDRDPHSNCTVPWTPGLEFMGKRGWFHDACQGSLYDLLGRCYNGPCEVGLERFPAVVENGRVFAKLQELSRGPARDLSATPLNP